MKLSEIMEKAKHGEVYQTTWHHAKMEISITEDGKKDLLWHRAPDILENELVGHAVRLEHGIIEANWELTDIKGKYTEKVKCFIGKGWFWSDKDLSRKIKEELNKTISSYRKIGYEVKIQPENFHTFEVGVIFVNFKYEGINQFIVGFHVDKGTRELKKTFLTLQDEIRNPLYESFREKFKESSVGSDYKGFDFLDPIRYLQKHRVGLLFKNNQ